MQDGDDFPKSTAELMSYEERRGERVFKSRSREKRVEAYAKAKALRAEMQQKATFFITPEFLPGFWLPQGLILVGGMSGHSKSTTAANVIAGLLEHESNRRVLVISNEENADSVLDRVSCIITNKSYSDVVRGKLPRNDLALVEHKSLELAGTIEVVCSDDEYDVTIIEDVEAVLRHASKEKLDMVVFDYLQATTSSRENPEMSSYEVLKRLGFFLKKFGQEAAVPVVTFCQLKPPTDGSHFINRVQGDHTIYNHAFVVMEIKPDFATSTTRVTIQKDRYGPNSGKDIVLNYQNGKYSLP